VSKFLLSDNQAFMNPASQKVTYLAR